MKKLLFIIVVIFSINSFGQNHFLGVQFGSNFSNILRDSDFKIDQDILVSFTAGLTYDYRLKNGILLGSGLWYDRKGFKSQITFTNDEGISIGDGEYKSLFNYLSLPLKVGYSVGNKWSGFAYLGVVPSFLLQAKDVFESYDEQFDYLNDNTDITDYAERFELSGLFEIGCNYQLKERINLFLISSYLYSFTNMFKDADFRIVHQRINVSVGVKYALKSSTE